MRLFASLSSIFAVYSAIYFFPLSPSLPTRLFHLVMHPPVAKGGPFRSPSTLDWSGLDRNLAWLIARFLWLSHRACMSVARESRHFLHWSGLDRDSANCVFPLAISKADPRSFCGSLARTRRLRPGFASSAAIRTSMLSICKSAINAAGPTDPKHHLECVVLGPLQLSGHLGMSRRSVS